MLELIRQAEAELRDCLERHRHLVETIIAIDEWRVALPSNLKYRKDAWGDINEMLSELADEWEGEIKDSITQIETVLTKVKEMLDN